MSEVLVERPAGSDVEDLLAAADREDGLSVLRRPTHERDLGAITREIGAAARRVLLVAVTGRIDIGAAGKENSVEPFVDAAQRCLVIRDQRHEPRQRAEGGQHLHVALPEDVDERALTLAAYARGVLVEDGSWHWAAPEHAPPSIIMGYGSMTKPLIRQAIRILADAMTAARSAS